MILNIRFNTDSPEFRLLFFIMFTILGVYIFFVDLNEEDLIKHISFEKCKKGIDSFDRFWRISPLRGIEIIDRDNLF